MADRLLTILSGSISVSARGLKRREVKERCTKPAQQPPRGRQSSGAPSLLVGRCCRGGHEELQHISRPLRIEPRLAQGQPEALSQKSQEAKTEKGKGPVWLTQQKGIRQTTSNHSVPGANCRTPGCSTLTKDPSRKNEQFCGFDPHGTATWPRCSSEIMSQLSCIGYVMTTSRNQCGIPRLLTSETILPHWNST